MSLTQSQGWLLKLPSPPDRLSIKKYNDNIMTMVMCSSYLLSTWCSKVVALAKAITIMHVGTILQFNILDCVILCYSYSFQIALANSTLSFICAEKS